MRYRLTLALAGLLAAWPTGLDARQTQPSSPDPAAGRRLVARAIGDSPPSIDGRLDEPAWRAAEPATDFVQMQPNPGEPGRRPTEARVLYDEAAIYVGMRMYDEPDSIAAQLGRRDASGVFTDWAHVLIDSYHDRRTAFRFSVSPRGTRKDVLHFNDTWEDINWDAVWESAVRIDSAGWTAEFRIPLSQLRFSAGEGDAMVWGVNFGREIARHGERSWWSPVPPGTGRMVSHSGELHGLAGLESPRRLEILPYTVARLTRSPEQDGNPLWERNDPAGAVGVDLRYGVTSNLTLSATVNPDFGQVEADPSVVNLTAFETFFPEKRPFFVEGSNIFEFNVGTDDGSGEQLFYSRRIGRAPQRGVEVGLGEHIARPDATTILGAAKLSGRTAGGWTIGVLDAVTGREEATIAAGADDRRTEPVEPLTNYAVAGLSRDYRQGRSSVGLFGTATHRRLGDGGEFDLLTSAAYALGLRGRHRFADDTWEAEAYVAGSHIRGSEAALARVQTAAGHYFQRPDADHLEYDPTRTALSGLVGHVWIGKIGGSNLRGGVGGHLRTPGFEINDLGFQSDADQGLVFGNLRYHQFEPRWIFRSFTIGLNPSAGWTLGGERIWAQLGSWTDWELKSFWNIGWWAARRFSGHNVSTLRGGPALGRDPAVNANAWIWTDRRKALRGNLNFGGSREDAGGSWSYSISPGLSFRPSGQLTMDLSPRFQRNHNTWQYVAQPEVADGRQYVVGELDQTTVALTTRLGYTITPTLSLELYAQPFISGGEYVGFRRVADAHAREFDDRFAPLDAALDPTDGRYAADLDGDGTRELRFSNPDFSFRQMRGNAVLRWEYRPGSTLYLVWSQSRTAYLPGSVGSDAFDLDRDVRRLFNRDDAFPTPVTSVFLIKFNYWLNI